MFLHNFINRKAPKDFAPRQKINKCLKGRSHYKEHSDAAQYNRQADII